MAGNALTLTLQLKRTGATAGVLVKKADASNGYQLSVTATGTLQFEIRQAGTTKTVTSTTTIPLNQWRHIAARYDGSALRVFINGTIDTATTAATGALVATTQPLWIGGDTTYLNGSLDDLSIYNRALSDAEITNLSNNRMGRYEYHHLNALGSNIVLTDDNQNVLVRYEYDVFGAIRSETGTSDNTRKFTGKEFDADSNLYHYAARYYDPYIGRFTQRDPAGDGVNWYVYTANNPVSFIDPTGLRRVNAREKDALMFTFGYEVGNFLASRINIKFVDGLPRGGRVPHYTLDGKRNTSEIWLRLSYDENSLYWLGAFIHEATHIWQRQTNRHRDGVGGRDYDYDANQLASRNLKIEEHAKAVQDWFVAVYGSKNNLISDAPHLQRTHLTPGEVWGDTLGRLGFDSADRDVFDTRTKLSIINNAYAPILQEIRQTRYLLTDRFR
ncbi:hypothetical protein F4X33_06500 [Candidatus Poribacteria bacterium]|nr:hypothetical protein [Candidatus Poribacteria bacterium]